MASFFRFWAAWMNGCGPLVGVQPGTMHPKRKPHLVHHTQVKRIIAEVGTDLQFLDDSGLSKPKEMDNVPLASPRSRDAEEDEAAAEENETVQHRNGLLANAHLRARTTGQLQLANQVPSRLCPHTGSAVVSVGSFPVAR